jgi:pilus assembly protein TadC
VTGSGPEPALLVLAAALLAWSPSSAVSRRRLRHVARQIGGQQGRVWAGIRRPAGTVVRRRALAVAAGLAAGALLGGGAPGVVAAGAVAVGTDRLLNRREGDGDGERALAGEVPVACDLIAVCLTGGLPVGSALAAVSDATAEPLAGQLRTVAALYRLGAAPARAWADVPVSLAALGRVLVRAGESGSSVVPALRSLATDARAEATARTEAAVRRAGVWVLAPLGACFLPAFLCLGVVPLVLGIAHQVFR